MSSHFDLEIVIHPNAQCFKLIQLNGCDGELFLNAFDVIVFHSKAQWHNRRCWRKKLTIKFKLVVTSGCICWLICQTKSEFTNMHRGAKCYIMHAYSRFVRFYVWEFKFYAVNFSKTSDITIKQRKHPRIRIHHWKIPQATKTTIIIMLILLYGTRADDRQYEGKNTNTQHFHCQKFEYNNFILRRIENLLNADDDKKAIPMPGECQVNVKLWFVLMSLLRMG